MTKAAIIISAILVFAGVAAAGSLPGLSGGGSNSPTLDTPTLGTTTDATTTNRRRRDAAEDISGPCDEAEHANDPRCTGVGERQTTSRTTTIGEARRRRRGRDANDPRCTGARRTTTATAEPRPGRR